MGTVTCSVASRPRPRDATDIEAKYADPWATDLSYWPAKLCRPYATIQHFAAGARPNSAMPYHGLAYFGSVAFPVFLIVRLRPTLEK